MLVARCTHDFPVDTNCMNGT